MPVDDGYEVRTAEEILDPTADALLDEQPTANPRAESTLTYAYLFSVTSTLADQQEQDLQDVYNSAYLADATGEELTKKARNLNIVRKSAAKATGVVTFSRNDPATTTRTVPGGTLVETVEDTPVQFETTEETAIRYYDGFESGTLDSAYAGDTGSVTVQSTTVDTGSNALELPATSGTEVHRTDVTTEHGQVLNVALHPNGGVVYYLFAVQSTNPASNHYRVVLDASAGSVKLEEVDGGASTTIDSASVSLSSEFHDVEIDWAVDGSFIVDVDDSGGDVADLSGSNTTYTSGGIGFESGGSSVKKYADEATSRAASANVQATEGGADGNVGANTIGAMPSPPTGVTDVTNDRATGDPTFDDTNSDPFQAGRDREDDDELRKRALDTDASDEGPSANAVELALDSVDGVESTHVNTNQTGSASGGLDAYSSEVVVFGGDTFDVVKTLFETMSVTTLLRLQGGVNGTQESDTVHSELLDQDITVPITRPTEITFDLDVDVVHTASYDGSKVTKNTVVNYVGGTKLDDSSVTGLGLGEDVLVNEIENRIEDVRGVDYADVTLLDTDGDDVDDTTTDADGVPVLSIADSEVARLDADNITLSETAR